MFRVLVLPVAVVAAPAVSPVTASADAVFLVSGRVLHAERAFVVGATVYIDFCGGKIQLPLEQVEVIEPGAVPEREACAAGVPPGPVLGAREPVPTPGDAATGEPSSAAGPTPAQRAQASAGSETDRPGTTREYWRQRVDPLRERIADIDAELARLPQFRAEEMRLFVHGGNLRMAQERARYERIRASWEALLQSTLREARRAGVPPGWLRR